MGRMGFRKVSDVKLTQQITNLKVVGIMTHLAREYEAPQNYEIATRTQVDLFQDFISQLTLEPTVIKHVDNSAAQVKKKFTQFDMLELDLLLMEKIKNNSKTLDEQLNLFSIIGKPLLLLYKEMFHLIALLVTLESKKQDQIENQDNHHQSWL
ncbi:unnamed protein product [Paramecium primaurelia]|uniref:Alanine racemase N-terminal domain-containing protein n=1 Tax=Paramecium primaurelia TaxID=5886 RepID=A0A8S1N6L8_PARPR|nr:unnamed protein product [Paramecium primaurelia]